MVANHTLSLLSNSNPFPHARSPTTHFLSSHYTLFLFGPKKAVDMPLRLDKTQYARVSDGESDSSSRESISFLDASSLRQNVRSIRFLWVHGVLGIFWLIAFSSLLFLRSKPHAGSLSYPDLTSMYKKPRSYKVLHLTSFHQKALSTRPFHTAERTSHQVSRPTCQPIKASPTRQIMLIGIS